MLIRLVKRKIKNINSLISYSIDLNETLKKTILSNDIKNYSGVIAEDYIDKKRLEDKKNAEEKKHSVSDNLSSDKLKKPTYIDSSDHGVKIYSFAPRAFGDPPEEKVRVRLRGSDKGNGTLLEQQINSLMYDDYGRVIGAMGKYFELPPRNQTYVEALLDRYKFPPRVDKNNKTQYKGFRSDEL